jgi:hypothetical protein
MALLSPAIDHLHFPPSEAVTNVLCIEMLSPAIRIRLAHLMRDIAAV